MKDESNEILDDFLAQWHRWANGYKYGAEINPSPTFRECRSNHRQWSSLDEIVEEDKSQMKTLDHLVMELCDVYRTAIEINARNLHTGRSVWFSARLPKDPLIRATVLNDARSALRIKMRITGEFPEFNRVNTYKNSVQRTESVI